MRAKLVLVRLLAPLAMVILSASVATAQTNTWSLSGVTFDDGTTVAGRLTVTYFHDVDNDSFTTINWNVTVQLGTNPAFTARTYDLGNSRTLFLGILDPVILLEEFPAPPGAGGQRQFRITPAFPLDGTRATVPVVIGVAGTAGSQECFNCTPFRRITAGNFVLVPAVPVMTVPALFGLTGLLLSLGSWAILSRGAGLRRRSRCRTRIGPKCRAPSRRRFSGSISCAGVIPHAR